jgi:hypothetical protein
MKRIRRLAHRLEWDARPLLVWPTPVAKRKGTDMRIEEARIEEMWIGADPKST